MLEMMCALLGTPNDRIWPGLLTMPHYGLLQLPFQPYNYLKKVREGVQAAPGRTISLVHGPVQWV